MKGKQRSLNGLFWRYLLSTMALLAGVLLALWFVLLQLIRMGAVLPADTGARNLERTTVLLQAQETFDPGEIPFYYRWALADSSGILESNLSPKEETWAQKVLAGEVSRHGFLYTKRLRSALMLSSILSSSSSVSRGSSFLLRPSLASLMKRRRRELMELSSFARNTSLIRLIHSGSLSYA